MGCSYSEVGGDIPYFNLKDNSSFNSKSKVRKNKINENNEPTNNSNKYELKKFRQLMYENI